MDEAPEAGLQAVAGRRRVVAVAQAHEEGLDAVLGVVGELPELPRPEPVLGAGRPVDRRLGDPEERRLHALQLGPEERDVAADARLQLVLRREQVAQLGQERGHRPRHDVVHGWAGHPEPEDSGQGGKNRDRDRNNRSTRGRNPVLGRSG